VKQKFIEAFEGLVQFLVKIALFRAKKVNKRVLPTLNKKRLPKT
jgi:hypothetical protein